MTWETAREFILPALKDETETTLLALINCGHAQLWEAPDAAMVTELTADHECHVWLAGGKLRAVLALGVGLLAWARSQGCTRVVITGRKGWARTLRPLGFTGNGSELRKAL